MTCSKGIYNDSGLTQTITTLWKNEALLNLGGHERSSKIQASRFKKLNSNSIILTETGYDGLDAGIRPRREYDDAK